jgi:DNA-directed RNA polymerase sigma subunit (sigma70/sigma32)
MHSKEEIEQAITECLDEWEQKIIRTRFGLDNGMTSSLKQLQERFGVTREQVRDIEKKVLRFLRNNIE